MPCPTNMLSSRWLYNTAFPVLLLLFVTLCLCRLGTLLLGRSAYFHEVRRLSNQHQIDSSHGHFISGYRLLDVPAIKFKAEQRRFDLDGFLHLSSEIKGFVFDELGRTAVDTRLSSSLLFNFTEDVAIFLRRVRLFDKKAKPLIKNPTFVLQDGVIKAVFTVTILPTETGENYSETTFLYSTEFDLKLHARQLQSNRIVASLNIQSPGEKIGNPQLFNLKDTLHLIWMTKTEKEDEWKTRCITYPNGEVVRLRFRNWTESRPPPRGAILVDEESLYLIESFDPLRVIRCDTHSLCERFHWQKDDIPASETLGQTYEIRGTSFIRYKWPLYIGLISAESGNAKGGNTFHIVVISVRPEFRIVYVSEPLRMHEEFVRSFPKNMPKTPSGIHLEDFDSLTFGLTVNDQSYLIRVYGLQGMMFDIIRTDEASQKGGQGGPKSGTLKSYLAYI